MGIFYENPSLLNWNPASWNCDFHQFPDGAMCHERLGPSLKIPFELRFSSVSGRRNAPSKTCLPISAPFSSPSRFCGKRDAGHPLRSLSNGWRSRVQSPRFDSKRRSAVALTHAEIYPGRSAQGKSRTICSNPGIEPEHRHFRSVPSWLRAKPDTAQSRWSRCPCSNPGSTDRPRGRPGHCPYI